MAPAKWRGNKAKGALCEVCVWVSAWAGVSVCAGEVYPNRQDAVCARCVDFVEWMVILSVQRRVCVRACEREQTCTLNTAAQNSSLPVQVCPHVTAVRSRLRREDDRILGPHLLCNFLFVSIASKNIFAQSDSAARQIKGQSPWSRGSLTRWQTALSLKICSLVVFRGRRPDGGISYKQSLSCVKVWPAESRYSQVAPMETSAFAVFDIWIRCFPPTYEYLCGHIVKKNLCGGHTFFFNVQWCTITTVCFI